MNRLLSALRDLFLGKQPPKLRNRAGGLAWITDAEHGLYGRIVTTVRVDERRHWAIDPPQDCTLTGGPYLTVEGTVVGEGDSAKLLGLHDDYLQPLRDPGHDERDESLSWAPAPPKVIPLKVKGWVS